MTEKSTAYTYGKFILAGGVVIYAIGQSLLFIIVAPMARSIGLTELEFGATFSLANVSLIFAAPFWGKKSDSIGRKPVFILGLFGSGIGTLAMAYSLNLGLRHSITTTGLMAMIFLSRVTYGLTASSIYPSASGYIADVTNWQNRARGMAMIGSANSIGSILGPAIGGGLAFMGALFPMYAAAAISIIGGLAALIWLVEPDQHRERKKQKNPPKSTLKITDRRLRPYMIMWSTFFVIFISLNFVTSFYLQDRFGITSMAAVMRTASIMLACMAIIITLIQGVLFQIIRISPPVLLRLCAPAFSVGMFTIAFAPSIPILAVGFACLGVALACATPGINGSTSLSVEPYEQGAAAGYLAAATVSGAILGPIVGTSLYKLQPNAPMLFGGVLMLIMSFYALTIPRPQSLSKTV